MPVPSTRSRLLWSAVIAGAVWTVLAVAGFLALRWQAYDSAHGLAQTWYHIHVQPDGGPHAPVHEVEVPRAPYLEQARRQVRGTLAVVGGIWLAGLLFGYLGYRSLARTLRGERAALDEAERARRIVENSSCVVFSWSPAPGWPVSFVTDNVADWGLDPAELLAGRTTFLDLVHPDDQERFAAEVQDNLQAGSATFYQTYRIVLPDGRSQWLGDWTVVDRGDDGEVKAFHGIVIDLSELREAQRELNLSHERLRLVLEGADLGGWDWNAVTGEVVFNERWAGMLGLRLADLRTDLEEWSSRVHPDDLGPTMELLQQHLEGGSEVYESLYRMRHADGSWRWILDRGRVVERLEDGTALRVTGTHLDMTDRQQMESVRRDLERDRQQAARLQSMGLLTGGIAHDFNNQLQVIRGNAEILAQNAADEDQRFFRSIIHAVDHSSALCDRMLVYAGQHQLKAVQPLDLAAELERIVDELGAEPGSVAVAAPVGGAPAAVDPQRFRELMRAILDNAMEACADQPSVRIHIDLDAIDTDERMLLQSGHHELAPGRYLRISVSDNGCGMSDETLAHATEPFYTTKFLGRGLGLAVASTLAKQHGGDLDLESRPGEGSTVSVFLPLLS